MLAFQGDSKRVTDLVLKDHMRYFQTFIFLCGLLNIKIVIIRNCRLINYAEGNSCNIHKVVMFSLSSIQR